MRVVLDTSVVVSAFRSKRGASYALMQAVAESAFTTGLSLAEIDAVLEELALLVEPVEVRFRWRPQLRDPGDELVLEAAVNGRADALVMYNVRDFADAAPRFALRTAGPLEMLGVIRP